MPFVQNLLEKWEKLSLAMYKMLSDIQQTQTVVRYNESVSFILFSSGTNN